MITFSQLGLSEKLLQATDALGFEHPTEIQQKAIPVLLRKESDLIALAQTGTGKTAAFGLPMLHHLDVKRKHPQVLILAPTRELCLQITQDLKQFSRFMPQVQITAVYGGSSIVAQIRELRQGSQVVVATPGRLIDLLDRKALDISRIETVILDEADEMLNMGFQEDMETILARTPEEKITALFSATMPPEIREMAQQYLRETEEVAVGRKNAASADITHQYAVVHAKDKLPALKRIIDFNPDFFGIVFCTTRLETQEISDAMVKAGYNADCLHGDLSQQQRDTVMGKFRKRMVRVLCATDVAARGIDVQQITHVIHYHLPDDIENYTHRSGRTARAGRKGISIALLHIREAYKLHQIERVANMRFEKFLIPKGDAVMEKRTTHFIESFLHEPLDATMPWNTEADWLQPLRALDKDHIIRLLLAREWKKLDADYLQHPDLNVYETPKTQGHAASSSRNSGRGQQHKPIPGQVRMFINLGKKDRIRFDEMREFLFQQTRVSGHKIRDIDMQPTCSFFETDAGSAGKILSIKHPIQYKGRSVRISYADQDGQAPAPPSSGRAPRQGQYSSEKKSGKGPTYKAPQPRAQRRTQDETDW